MSIQGTSLWGGFFPHGEAHEGRNDEDPRERLRQGGGARAGAMTAEHLGHPTAPAPLGRRSGAQWMRTRRSRSISAARHPPPRPPTPPTPLGLAPGDHPRLSDPVKDRSGRAPAHPDLTAGPVRLITDGSI